MEDTFDEMFKGMERLKLQTEKRDKGYTLQSNYRDDGMHNNIQPTQNRHSASLQVGQVGTEYKLVETDCDLLVLDQDLLDQVWVFKSHRGWTSNLFHL